MNTIAYKCPCCAAPLAFGGASGRLECASCGNSYETDALDAMYAGGSSGGMQFELHAESFDEAEAQAMQAYICKGCGAELMTEGTTTATECPYCGSPTILPDRIEGGVRPELVIPFTITKEQAQQQFDEYFKGKLLLPNIFRDSRNRISDMRKLYVPYWLFDCGAQANIVYDAEKKETRREGDWEVTRTEHYIVRRKGSMAFERIPVDGSVKLDNKITESVEPYDLSAAVPFAPAVLAGALADHADVNADECEARAAERVEKSVVSAMRDTVVGYTHVSERSRNIETEEGKVTPVLMPIWLITTEKDGETYTFAINGQTGKLTCDVPADKKKALAWGAGVFAGVFGLGVLILYFLQQFGSGTMLMAGIIAVIAALVTVGSLKAQLKQAVLSSGASEYIKEGSFKLDVSYDKFLYERTTRRKIETGEQKK